MSNNRPMYQLLTIIYNRLENEPDYLVAGLCPTVTKLRTDGYISFDEFYVLTNYISKHRPQNSFNYRWYWKPYELPPRMSWLSEHIKLITPKDEITK